jgi:hypothetical protein
MVFYATSGARPVPNPGKLKAYDAYIFRIMKRICLARLKQLNREDHEDHEDHEDRKEQSLRGLRGLGGS